MKKILLFLLLFVLTILQVNAWINSSIIFTWVTVMEEDIEKWNWWRIIFPDSLTWVIIDASDLNSDSNADINISWNFWIQNTSSTWNLDYWWTTFDIWTVTWAPKVSLVNNIDNTFTFEWYAWSNTSWWIYFWDTWITNWKVVYNRNTWKVDGCAWSQNLWWLCIDNFNLDTTVPDLSSLDTLFTTNHNKNINLWITDIATIKIENWDSIAKTTYSNTSSFTHDFRKAKLYEIKVTDTSWNYSTGTIQVVAWTPSLSLIDWWFWSNASEFSPTTTPPLLIANWIDIQQVRFSLRDTYWNPIVNEIWIKEVEVELWFENNVDKNQINNLDFWDAIKYSNNQFGLISWVQTDWIWYNSSANYSIDISSLAPTKEWYIYTTDNNDIKINKLIIKVTALDSNSWVWEWNVSIFDSYINKKFRFFPSVSINNISNSNNWNIIRDIETSFTWEILIDSPNDVSNIEITHLLDTENTWTKTNYFLSFQDIILNSWWNVIWIGYLEPNITNTAYNYNCSNKWCIYDLLPYSSNIITKYTWTYDTDNSTLYDSFTTISKIVLAWLSEYDIRYSSIIEYKTDWNIIKYPSFNYLETNTIINNQIKIVWLMNENNDSFSVISDDTTNKIWDISKAELYMNIKKNIVWYQAIWTWDYWTVRYISNWNYTLDWWPSWIDTIIVDWWDLIITWDINKLWNKINSIIAFKWENYDKWNIWVTKDVQRIEAILLTDRSVLSWNGTDIYNDNIALEQLYVKWSIISYNTVWWASSTIPQCPYYLTSCDLDIAKKYDLNHFRYFIKWTQWNVVPNLPNKDWYDTASMIVEYDSLLQINIPNVFLN